MATISEIRASLPRCYSKSTDYGEKTFDVEWVGTMCVRNGKNGHRDGRIMRAKAGKAKTLVGDINGDGLEDRFRISEGFEGRYNFGTRSGPRGYSRTFELPDSWMNKDGKVFLKGKTVKLKKKEDLDYARKGRDPVYPKISEDKVYVVVKFVLENPRYLYVRETRGFFESIINRDPPTGGYRLSDERLAVPKVVLKGVRTGQIVHEPVNIDHLVFVR